VIAEQLEALFGVYNEAVLAVSGSEFIYYNSAARRLLPDIEQLTPGDIFPCAVLEFKSSNFIGELDIAGRRATYSAAWFEGARIFSILSCDDGGATLPTAAFAAMSLEMKNYLAVLKLASSIVLPYVENTGDKRLGDYAAMINQSYYSLLRLTSNMEALSAGVDADARLRKSRFDLSQLCDELIDACAHLVEDRGVMLSFKRPEENITILADKAKIELMLLNMISNGLINTDKGGSVLVSTVLMRESVLISVTDTGGGISDEIKASAWNRYGEKRVLTDTKSGAGFGMAAVSQIARMHGGSVFLESRRGEGTVIAASIPVEQDGVGELSFNDPVAVYQSDGISPFLTGLATVLGFDKFKQKYMD